MRAMSQLTPPADVYLAESTAPYPPQPAPMSGAALVGFISSLVFPIPLVTQILGLILGIVGISVTSGGRARGRGLAVAAVVIAPLVAIGWMLIAVLVVILAVAAFGIAGDIKPLLEADQPNLPAVVSRVYEGSFSKRLKLRVSEQDVLDYLERVHEAYGNLEELEAAAQPWQTAGGGSSDLLLTGKFTKGSANIQLRLGFTGLSPEIDNITVGELTLAPEQ